MRSFIITSVSTSSSKCEPPCRSNPKLTCLFGKKLGKLFNESLLKKLGDANKSPITIVKKINIVFDLEK